MKTSPKRGVLAAKKKAIAVFNKYIRTRDCIDGFGNCVTCGKRVELGTGDAQAGHFISRQYENTRFDEHNVHLQCLTKESSLLLSDGSYKRINEINVGDTLIAFDEQTCEIKNSVVESVASFLPEELYEVELEDGKKFYATPDHRVVANNNWLQIADMLHGCNTYDIKEYEKNVQTN